MAKVSEFAQQSFMEELVFPDKNVETKQLSIGATLRAARRKRGATTVEKIAAEICAWPYHVKAIEKDQFDLLPGTTYAIGFIRAYANYVGLDGAALVQRFKDEMAPEPQALKEEAREPLEGRDISKWAMAATVLILLVGTYVTWLGFYGEAPPQQAPAAAPTSFVAEANMPAENAPPLELVAQPPMALARNPAIATSADLQKHRPVQHHHHAPLAQKASKAAKTLPPEQKSVEAIKPVRLRSISYIRHDASKVDALPLVDSKPAFNLLVRNTTAGPHMVDDHLRHQISFDPAAFREPMVP